MNKLESVLPASLRGSEIDTSNKDRKEKANSSNDLDKNERVKTVLYDKNGLFMETEDDQDQQEDEEQTNYDDTKDDDISFELEINNDQVTNENSNDLSVQEFDSVFGIDTKPIGQKHEPPKLGAEEAHDDYIG